MYRLGRFGRVVSTFFFLTQSSICTTTATAAALMPRGVFLNRILSNVFSSSFVLKSSLATLPKPGNMAEPIALLDSVYGPVESPHFPAPMPANEAGLCADGYQRRYLWTDAFGVLAYTTIAQEYQKQGNTNEYQKYKQAAETLIATVHQCLGTPRSSSSKSDDQMQRDPKSPTGFVGLRIGKTESKKITDYGMRYDGQYWHYVDKWLLALARSGHVQEGIQIAKSCFPYFFDAGPDGSGHAGGIRWKLSVDATPPSSLQRANASDDTLTALIVFSILESHRSAASSNPPDEESLSDEIHLLKQSLKGYRPRVTSDPLGWGLEALFDQFLKGQPRQASLHSIHSEALHPSHLSLPFRLYGAMIGARIGGEKVAPSKTVDELVRMSLAHERKVHGAEEHSTINRVMLAMCLLCPGALGRQPQDPFIDLDSF